jgi:deoxyribonuclease-4
MPLFGAHLSAKGGPANAVAAAVELGCQTLQIFTKFQKTWEAKPLRDEDAHAFREAVAAAGLRYPTAHSSYLINLSSPDDPLYQKSIDALTDEMNRAEALGLSYLVIHPGSHNGSGEGPGLARVAAALDAVHDRCRRHAVAILLETTAGQGSALGHRFEHLSAIIHATRDPDRLAVCLDTCHVFAAGYDLRTPEAYASTFDEFDRAVGLGRLKLFHVNDSLASLGSRVDRHAGIGLGEIGADAFRRLVTDPRFAELPMILETPKEDDDGNPMDAVNLRLLRNFANGE